MKQKKLTNGRRSGFTVLELLIVLACLTILIIPVWSIYRSGQRTSLQGMSQIDTSQEARRIIKQVHRDLKQSCYILYKSSPRIDFSFMLTVAPPDPPHQSFSFLSFPGMGDVADFVPSLGNPGNSGEAFRRLSRITYTLEPSGDPEKPLLQLIREEQFHPATVASASFPNGVRRHTLSSRVQYFTIERQVVQGNGEKQFFFRVTLQIVDGGKLRKFPFPVGTKVTERFPGILIAEFFDVVQSDFFHSVWNQEGMKRNWHSFLEAP